MGFTKIETADLVGKGVVGLPDTPNLSTTAMQEKLDELALQVIIPKINTLIAELEENTASGNIGAKIPTSVELELENATIQTILDAVAHIHQNHTSLDKFTEDENGNPLYGGKLVSGDAFASVVVADKTIEATNADSITFIAGDNIVIDVDAEAKTIKFTSLGGGGGAGGGGDMYTAVYDKDKDGIVDNASALGGNPPSYYQPVESEGLNTTDKNIVNAINEVKETADEANAKEVDTLTTMEQVQAATDPTIPVGAGAVKGLNESLQTVRTYVGSDGKLHFVDASGADSVLPFSSVKEINGSFTLDTGTTTNLTFPTSGYSTLTVTTSNYASGTRQLIITTSKGTTTLTNNDTATIDVSDDDSVIFKLNASQPVSGTYTLTP